MAKVGASNEVTVTPLKLGVTTKLNTKPVKELGKLFVSNQTISLKSPPTDPAIPQKSTAKINTVRYNTTQNNTAKNNAGKMCQFDTS